jgi:regulator of protease activity HflC (stomatin/prohibitin superfamily)
MKRKISLRARNLNAPTLKVNDQRGNPIEISAVVVWRVRDTAQAVFEVDDFETTCGAGRGRAAPPGVAVSPTTKARTWPHETTLRGGPDEVSEALRTELQARFAEAGVEVTTPN